jgi:hypothetical protein
MEIIPFKKKELIEPHFDYQAVRDMVLGEYDGLNIEESIRNVCSDYINADEETITNTAISMRKQLESILKNDECAKHFHDALFELDEICDENTTSGTMGFGSSCISFVTGNDTVVEIHVLQTGFVRFIKAIRTIHMGETNVTN